MKLILISAPYRSVPPPIREDITRSVEAAAMLLWDNGVAVVTPHLNTAHFSDHKSLDPAFYVLGYQEIATRVDAVLLLHNSQGISNGCAEECEIAKKRRKPIFKDVKALLRWAREAREAREA